MPAPRVLVAHGPARVRFVLAQVLRGAGMSVAVAPDLAAAARRLGWADVVVLDVEPVCDAVRAFLRGLMARSPLPVVACGPIAGDGVQAALEALEDGAVDLVTRPLLDVRGRVTASLVRLVHVVQAAATARVRRREPGEAASRVLPSRLPGPPRAPPLARSGGGVIAIGAATGGADAVRVFLRALPAGAPPVAIALRLPEVFTGAFARRLSEGCRVTVREARDGDRLRPGLALIAPGDRHLAIRRAGAELVARVITGASTDPRPGLDVLFRSARRAAGADAVGVILSGTGADGAAGLAELRRAGGRTFGQDEDSAIAFDLPGGAIACGAVEEVLPVQRLAAAILARPPPLVEAERQRRDGPSPPEVPSRDHPRSETPGLPGAAK